VDANDVIILKMLQPIKILKDLEFNNTKFIKMKIKSYLELKKIYEFVKLKKKFVSLYDENLIIN
jgi:hypothetical protein